MRWLPVVAALGCNSYVGPKYSKFVADPNPAKTPQIANLAITIRGTDGVLSAGGAHIGVVVTDGSVLLDGTNGGTSLVRDAAWAAAIAGGTHLMLHDSKVTRIDTTTQLAGAEARNPGVKRDEVHAVFDVFRVERDHWGMLEPKLRPTAAP